MNHLKISQTHKEKKRMWCRTNLQAPVVKWLTFEVATVPALCPLQGWLQPMMDVPSLLCCMFTAGMWEFLHGLGL